MAKEEKDYFELGFDGIVAEADRYLAEKAKREKERKNDGSKSHVD